ncbi:hypothetical protein [Streptomyces sp. Ru73]|uniref:hypothetical protein n=1 Tax=Streptomyces sp. Ru73 TaxID=2080748 RepID=UPI0015E4839D|nr:hypothetical protein [Streptomyces sp. Ru73]
MSPPDRKEAEVRRMLDGPHPLVPPDLAVRAAVRGRRLLFRRRLLGTAGWLLLFLAAVAFTVWAVTQQPWIPPPTRTTPPLEGW